MRGNWYVLFRYYTKRPWFRVRRYDWRQTSAVRVDIFIRYGCPKMIFDHLKMIPGILLNQFSNQSYKIIYVLVNLWQLAAYYISDCSLAMSKETLMQHFWGRYGFIFEATDFFFVSKNGICRRWQMTCTSFLFLLNLSMVSNCSAILFTHIHII